MAQPTFAVHGTYQADGSGNPFLTYLSTTGAVVFQIGSNGQLAVIDSITAAGIGSPLVVATSANANLLYSAFAAITLLAAATANAGTYQLTIAATVKTTITTATSWLFTAAYTDPIHTQTPTVCTSSTMTANATEQGTITFQSTGATAITITPTAASSDGGAIAYTAVLTRIA